MLSGTFKNLLLIVLMSFSLCVKAQDDSIFNVLQEIKIIGNKTTKERIILRELPFKPGDKISAAQLQKQLERAKSNLLNTLLFNFVTVDPVYLGEEKIAIYILLEERWYWWPMPIFEIQETNFNTWWETKDLERLNYGLYLAKENFRGRKERLMFKAQAGYTEQAGFRYSIPYINKKQTTGINFNFRYSRNHELTYATTTNRRDFYRSDDEYVKKQINTSFAYEIRPKLYNKHTFQLSYSNVHVDDTIALLNNDYLTNGESSMQFMSFTYQIKRDKRNFKSYPTLGYYYDLNIIKNGLGIIGKDLDKLYATTQYRKFVPLGSKFYAAGSIKLKYTFNEGPYFLYGGLGYVNNLVRGYELYVINGEHYVLSKAQLRFALLDNKIFKFKIIPAEKFNKIPLSIFLGTYFDLGYVDSNVNQQNNFLTNTALYGGGFSVDFVSYYDMVFRVEYSMNKLKEHGLYLHFVAPI